MTARQRTLECGTTHADSVSVSQLRIAKRKGTQFGCEECAYTSPLRGTRYCVLGRRATRCARILRCPHRSLLFRWFACKRRNGHAPLSSTDTAPRCKPGRRCAAAASHGALDGLRQRRRRHGRFGRLGLLRAPKRLVTELIVPKRRRSLQGTRRARARRAGRSTSHPNRRRGCRGCGRCRGSCRGAGGCHHRRMCRVGSAQIGRGWRFGVKMIARCECEDAWL